MDLPILKQGQKRVVIIGAGFGGIRLAQRLSPKLFQVILIDRNNYHQFQPLLYQVATSGLEPSSISFPLRKIFQDNKNVFIRIAEALKIDRESQLVNTSIGDIPYDYLVLAQGATTNYFNNMRIQEHAYPMKSVSESLLLRNTLLQNYEKSLIAQTNEEKEALLNVVIVGGGPTGVELAGAIAEMKKNILPKDYSEINFKQMKICQIEASPRLLGALSKKSAERVRNYLTKLDVEVLTDTSVIDYDGTTVVLNNGDKLVSNCLIWAAGVKGFSFEGMPEQVQAPNGRLKVNGFSQLDGNENIFVIGDAAIMSLPSLPKGHPQVAPVALQQATLLAKNLECIVKSQPMESFEYHDKGSMATVGRNKAVAEIGKIRLTGFFAWLTWMAVHLMSIIGVKNRLVVLLNWMWQYFTYDQSLRLIIKAEEKKITGNTSKNTAGMPV